MNTDFLTSLQESVRPAHTELIPTIFLSQDTLDSIRYTRWQSEHGENTDNVSFIAVLKNGKEIVLIKNVPSEVMYSYIENHPSTNVRRSHSSSRSDSSSSEESRSGSNSEYESDDCEETCNLSGNKCKCTKKNKKDDTSTNKSDDEDAE